MPGIPELNCDPETEQLAGDVVNLAGRLRHEVYCYQRRLEALAELPGTSARPWRGGEFLSWDVAVLSAATILKELRHG